MAPTNQNKPTTPAPRTHEGGLAKRVNAFTELRRSVLTCLLWEGTFYESGTATAKRIADLVKQCNPQDVADLAIYARKNMYLRHVPLFLVTQLCRRKDAGKIVAATLPQVIERADELSEFLAIYWEGKTNLPKRPWPLAAGAVRGLRAAFGKFNEYQLAKYNRNKGVTLKDVLRIVHPKPINKEQAALWQRLRDDQLATPDTWETELSAGKDKKATWERLLSEKKIGALAFLRNLRNMQDSGVKDSLISQRFKEPLEKVLPFRFIAAARNTKGWEDELSTAMLSSCAALPKLSGTTAVLIDVSGSMDHQISSKSDMQRIDAATALGAIVREVGERARVFSFSEKTVEVANHRGLPLCDAISNSQPHSGTRLGQAVRDVEKKGDFDRIIVVTDEQASDVVNYPTSIKNGYVINVATYKNGVGYGQWNHIDGWSERIIDFIYASEELNRK